MNREELSGVVGHEIVVGLNHPEGGGVEMLATLDEVRGDGVVLSEIGDLVPVPTLFCPWASFRRVRDRPPWFMPPRDEAGPEEELQVRELYEGEMHLEEMDPPTPLPERREPLARTLERVVPIAQRRSVGDITVALASLEFYGEGIGVLRWRVSLGDDALPRDPDLWFGIFEPIFEVRDDAGRELPWWPRSGGHDGESDGAVEVSGLPEAGEIEVVATHLVIDAYGPEGEYEGERPSHEGPWTFRFSI